MDRQIQGRTSMPHRHSKNTETDKVKFVIALHTPAHIQHRHTQTKRQPGTCTDRPIHTEIVLTRRQRPKQTQIDIISPHSLTWTRIWPGTGTGQRHRHANRRIHTHIHIYTYTDRYIKNTYEHIPINIYRYQYRPMGRHRQNQTHSTFKYTCTYKAQTHRQSHQQAEAHTDTNIQKQFSQLARDKKHTKTNSPYSYRHMHIHRRMHRHRQRQRHKQRQTHNTLTYTFTYTALTHRKRHKLVEAQTDTNIQNQS